MKNQYFGDVNDYRNYGLLRLLANGGALRIGVCWMLTPDDDSTDGGKAKLHYLRKKYVARWRRFDEPLYNLIREEIWDAEKDEVKKASRLVSHFNRDFVPNSIVWRRDLEDCPTKSGNYFNEMFKWFKKKKARLIFFDPDNGPAGNVGQRSMRKGATTSCKYLLAKACVDHGFSALVYQHFQQKPPIEKRKTLTDVIEEVRAFTTAKRLAYFITPDAFYVLIPTAEGESFLLSAAKRVARSKWATCRGTTKSKITNGKQIAPFITSASPSRMERSCQTDRW